MSIKHATLGLLAEGPKSGYDLVREFDHRRSVVWPAPQNEIYRELAKLTEAGWIKTHGQETGPRRRQLYAITPTGRRELRSWLLADEADHSFRYEPVLRAVFLTQLPPADVRRRLERDLQFFEQALAAVRDDPQSPSDEPTRRLRAHRRYARPLVEAFYAGLVRWSRQCLADLPADKRTSRPRSAAKA